MGPNLFDPKLNLAYASSKLFLSLAKVQLSPGQPPKQQQPMGQLGHADSAWQKVKGTYMGEMPSTFGTLEFSLVGAISLELIIFQLWLNAREGQA